MPEDVSIGCANEPMVRVIVLAGGKGKRMLSNTPKVLHTVGGKTILSHVIDKASLVSDVPPIIVYGEDLKDVKNKTVFGSLEWVYQDKPLPNRPRCCQSLTLYQRHRYHAYYVR